MPARHDVLNAAKAAVRAYAHDPSKAKCHRSRYRLAAGARPRWRRCLAQGGEAARDVKNAGHGGVSTS
jgi:hypothetical protein